jgi:ubiquinone/menaquinone biosynthesis C-methylase UbiE
MLAPANNATAQKYDSVATYFGLYDLLHFYPWKFRSKGADALGNVWGKRVLEVGCGNGLNFKHLLEKIGPGGELIGIDISKGMIDVAQTRCGRSLWSNVYTYVADAGEYRACSPFDAVYFGLSFTILDDPSRVLHNILSQLRPGGRIVVLETRIPTWLPRFVEGWLTKYAHRNFGTNFDINPWELFEQYEHRGILTKVTTETIRSYSFYVLSGNRA